MLQRDGDGKIKILVTSRPTAEIHEGLQGFSTLTMSENSNFDDIEAHLNAELDREISRGRRWGEKLAELVDRRELRQEMQVSGDYGRRLTELVEHAPDTLTWKSVIVSFLAEKAGGM